MIRRCLSIATVLAASAVTMVAGQSAFRSAVTSISIDVSVKARNVPVLGLTAADFVLVDNGVPQAVEAVSIDAVPIDATLFLDTSPSLFGEQGKLKADIAKIAGLLRPSDRLRLLVFDDQVRDVFGWSGGGTLDVGSAIHGLGVGEISAVYDGLILAMLHRPDPDRRHLVIAMTDGRDTGSVTDSLQVRDVARRTESVLHLIVVDGNPSGVSRNGPSGLLAFGWPSMPDRNGARNLAEAAEITGGRMHASSFFGLGVDSVKAFKAALDDFRQSYILRYTLTGVTREGWHDVEVRVKKPAGLTIRSRRGYFGTAAR